MTIIPCHQQQPPCIIAVDAVLNKHSSAPLELVRAAAQSFLESMTKIPASIGTLPRQLYALHVSVLAENIEALSIVDITHQGGHKSFFLPWEVVWEVHAYALNYSGPEDADSDDDDEAGDSGGALPAYRQWPSLPSADFHGLWESLHYDDMKIKRRLLRYADSSFILSRHNVDLNLIGAGRLVLLHGPPGTGKTSLCKALAQRLSIRLGTPFFPTGTELIEVNGHALFSRWFSESGKLVTKLFERIREKLDDPELLLFVLVDEVESLATKRPGCGGGGGSGGEPSDAIRAVNALLTQLDSLRRYPNCMVLTTSNITGSVDTAFLDRADIKGYIGPPNEKARYEMLRSSVHELTKKKVICAADGGGADCGTDGSDQPLLKYEEAMRERERRGYMYVNETREGGCASATMAMVMGTEEAEVDIDGSCPAPPHPPPPVLAQGEVPTPASASASASSASVALIDVARAAEGFSGRTLRKIPFIAHAHGAGGGVGVGVGGRRFASAAEFVAAMMSAVEEEKADRDALLL